MAKKLLSVRVPGINGTWDIPFYDDPKHIPAWRADGLDVIEVANIVPAWIADLGLTRVWCFAQDLFNFKNPWRQT